MTIFWAERTLDGESVAIESREGTITSITAETVAPAGAIRLPGLTVPGFVNGHSHAFHRLLRGNTHDGRGDFWSWREAMYEVADRITPDVQRTLATAVYSEMALCGITTVAEFHYLHHGPGGVRYADPNEMGRALIDGALAAGVRLTLLDTLYLQAGLDESPLTGTQLRFGDQSFERWADRVSDLEDGPTWRIGAGVHSVRAVPTDDIGRVASWARAETRPLHVHVSEQPAENSDCLAATGLTPTAVLAEAGALGPSTTAVHATHLTASDVDRLGRSGTGVCMCPTTERDLGDGVGPADQLVRAGSPLSLGSDSHAVIDLLEEARAVEMNLRVSQQQRGMVEPAVLAGALWHPASAGWAGGQIAVGHVADLTSLSLTSIRTSGSDGLGALVFAATASDVTHVVVDGELVVEDGRHRLIDDPAALIREVTRQVQP